MVRLAIITARGGSKRLPGKNIKDFCGKPIIAYSIQAAVESNVFDEVMVSTDSEEIAEVSKAYGAVVPFYRTEQTSNDFATTSDVLVEVLGEYAKRGCDITEACCIYPTAPFVTADKLRKSMEMLDTDTDTVIPVVRFSYPPQRGMVITDSYLTMKQPEYSRTRSQDLEPLYHDCGQFYSFKVEPFLMTKNLLSGRVKPLICSELEVQDIDNLTDWKLAELKYQMMMGD